MSIVKTVTKNECVKSLGIVGAMSVVVGGIIGSGIFMNVAPTLMATPQSLGFLMVYWFVGGLISVIGGLCYAELGCTFPESGGERTYFAKSFGVPFGVTFTYIYTFIIKSTACAGLSIACGTYLVEMFLPKCRETSSMVKLVGSITLLTLMLLNCTSKNAAAKTSIISTASKLLTLIIIIGTGIVTMIRGQGLNLKNIFSYEYLSISKMGNVFVNILWAMEGWNILGALVGDMKNPKRDLPIVMPLALGMVLIVYCLTVISYVAVLGYEGVMESQAVAIYFANKMLGHFGKVIPICIAASVFGALNSNVYSVSTVVMVSGYQKEIPEIFSLVRRKQRTPVVGIISLVVITFIFLPFEFESLVSYCSFLSWFFYFMTFSVIVYIRFKRKDIHATFRVPIILPILMQLVSLYIMFAVCVLEKKYVGCVVMMIVVVVVFAIHNLPMEKRSHRFFNEFHDFLMKKACSMFDLVPAQEYDIV